MTTERVSDIESDTIAHEADALPPEEPARPLMAMWREVYGDMVALFRSEAILARLEAKQNLRNYAMAFALFGVALVLLVMTAVFLLVAGIVALAHLIGLLWALLVIGLGCAIVALILLLRGRMLLRSSSLLPVHSMNRLSADIKMLKERTGRGAGIHE